MHPKAGEPYTRRLAKLGRRIAIYNSAEYIKHQVRKLARLKQKNKGG